MSYSPPTITNVGLTIPSFNDILTYLIAQYQNIYGSATFLGDSSPDYQDISIRALQANDTDQGLQAAYNSFNPQTALGAALDLLGRLIGTARKAASASVANVTLSGTVGTVITNGVVQDVNGNYWNVASPSTIGSGGTVVVPATAQQLGNITANPGDISKIVTPTAGWTAVTNTYAASPGQPVEPDSAYRARLEISQTKPSISLRAGTAAAVAAVAGVTRSVVYENTENYTSSFGFADVDGSGLIVTMLTGYPFDSSMVGAPCSVNGVAGVVSAVGGSTQFTLTTALSGAPLTSVAFFVGDGFELGPAHSITCVVEGGLGANIAQAIYSNRGLGCLVNGTTDVPVIDPSNPTVTMTMRYDVLQYTPIAVDLYVHPLTGYTTAVGNEIVSGVVSYLNSLGIGESVLYSELFRAALTGNSGAGTAASPNPDQPVCSIRSITFGAIASPTTMGTLDIPIDYNFAALGEIANVTLFLV